MAFTTRVHGATGSFSAVGKQEYAFKTIAKTNITQAELDAFVQEVQQLNTIMIIGTFTAGSSDTVNMLVEGKGVANQSNDTFAGVAGVTITDLAF
jgi:hypothetical protein